MDNSSVVPTRRTDVIVRELEDETLILDGQSGKVHQLNSTAGFIWACCDGVSSMSDIVHRLAVEFNIPTMSAASDVANTIGKFRELGLLVASQTTKTVKSG